MRHSAIVNEYSGPCFATLIYVPRDLDNSLLLRTSSLPPCDAATGATLRREINVKPEIGILTTG